MAKYIEIEEARDLPGLRLVLTAGVPGPYGESARYTFDVKKIPYARVRQAPGESDEALRAWTAQTSAPVAILEDERPRSSWAEILYLAERLAPEPRLIPADPADRVRMFGLSHELCGDKGFGWERRLMLLQPMLASGAGGERMQRFGAKYGYSPEAAAAAPARCAEILRALSAQLREQSERGSRFFVGQQLSALDLYWAAFSAMLEPMPPELCPMPENLRAGYLATPELRDVADPLLLEHRDFVFQKYLELPLDY